MKSTSQELRDARRFLATILPVLLTLILLGANRSSAQVDLYHDEPAAHGNTARPAYSTERGGFYLAVGAAGSHIDFEEGEGPDQAVQVDSRGEGGELQVGYAFTEGFALELRLVGTRHDTDRVDVDAIFAQLQLDAVAHLMPGQRFRPYVAGGIGAAAFGLEGTGVDEDHIRGGQVDFGGGFEYHLGPRFALSLNYRYALQSFEERVDRNEDVTRVFAIDREGSSHTWGGRVTFSF